MNSEEVPKIEKVKDGVVYTINTVNEVTALSDGTSFTYDDNGNRTQKMKGTDTWDYTYDYANRLTEIKENSTVIGEYVYDGDGRRLQATENGITTTYIYDNLNVIYEEKTNGTTTYIYGPTGRLARRTTINQVSNTYFYHTDHLGSTRLVTDSSKNIVAAATYHPFGDVSTVEGPEHYLFTGKEKDSTGIYYYGARYYDSQIGRFLTRDPYTFLPDDPRVIGNSDGIYQGPMNPQKLNRYSYAGNNPLKFNDPTGLCSVCAEIRYELTHENSLDSIWSRWEYIVYLDDAKLDDYFVMILYYSLGMSLYYSGGGDSGNCYWVATDCDGHVTLYPGTLEGLVQAQKDARARDFIARILGQGCETEYDHFCTGPAFVGIKDGGKSGTVEPCAGTSLLSIFFGLAIFVVSMRQEKRMI